MYFCISSKQERVEPSVRMIIKALRLRVNAFETLSSLLEEINKAAKAKGKNKTGSVNNLTLHPKCDWLPHTNAIIGSFNLIEDDVSPGEDDDEGESFSSLSKSASEKRYATSIMLPNDKNVALNCTITISCEYPMKPPFWNIESTAKTSALSSNNIKSLEREVNSDYDSLTIDGDYADGMDYILTHQIRRVAGVFEKLVGGTLHGQIGGLRMRKGRDRKRPMAFEIDKS